MDATPCSIMLKTLYDTSKLVDQLMQDVFNMIVIVHRIIVYGPIFVMCITSQFFGQLTPVF